MVQLLRILATPFFVPALNCFPFLVLPARLAKKYNIYPKRLHDHWELVAMLFCIYGNRAFLLNIRQFYEYSADTFGQTLELKEQLTVFTAVSFFTQLNNKISSKIGSSWKRIPGWWRWAVKMVAKVRTTHRVATQIGVFCVSLRRQVNIECFEIFYVIQTLLTTASCGCWKVGGISSY